MNRRSMLKGAAVAAAVPFVAGPVFAAAGDAEATHVKRTMQVGALSLTTSRIAVQKATTPKVLEFAKFEVAEQETIANILKGMKDSALGNSGDVVPPTDAEVRSAIPAADRDKVTQLDSLSGADFEKQYIAVQTDGHTQLLQIQQDYLSTGKNREHLNVAKLAKGMITEHLQLLKDLQSA